VARAKHRLSKFLLTGMADGPHGCDGLDAEDLAWIRTSRAFPATGASPRQTLRCSAYFHEVEPMAATDGGRGLLAYPTQAVKVTTAKSGRDEAVAGPSGYRSNICGDARGGMGDFFRR